MTKGLRLLIKNEKHLRANVYSLFMFLVETQGLNVGAKKKKGATGPSPQKKATQDYAATVNAHA